MAEFARTATGITIDDVIRVGNLLEVISIDSLYSYVFKVSINGRLYAIKIVIIASNRTSKRKAKSDDSTQSVSITGLDRRKKTMPVRRFEQEIEWLRRVNNELPSIAPKMQTYSIVLDFTECQRIIYSLISISSHEDTKTILQSYIDVLDNLKSEFGKVGIGILITDFVEGLTVWKSSKSIEKRISYDSHKSVQFQSLFLNMVSKLVIVVMNAIVPMDLHLNNAITSNSAPKKEEKARVEAAATAKNPIMDFFALQQFDTIIVDFGDIHSRLHVFHDIARDSIERLVAKALWDNLDEDDMRNVDELPVEYSRELLIKLMTTNDVIDINEIQDINDLRIVLCAIRVTTPQYAWLSEFINDNDFLNNLLLYLRAIRREMENETRLLQPVSESVSKAVSVKDTTVIEFTKNALPQIQHAIDKVEEPFQIPVSQIPPLEDDESQSYDEFAPSQRSDYSDVSQSSAKKKGKKGKKGGKSKRKPKNTTRKTKKRRTRKRVRQ